MPSGLSDRESSRHSAGLLLRVHRPGGRADEFYLAGGLTIGRSVANAVVLADDDSVDRAHARVEVAGDGAARLRCIEPGSSISAGEAAVHELALDAGVWFRVGRTEFECVAGRRGADRPEGPARTACPFCASTDVATAGEEVRQCPACEGLILPVRPDPHDEEPILLPAVYGGYRAERYVARGGMGLVLKGARDGGGEPVAIKVLLPGALADRREAGLFEREVVMMERVHSPHVVRLLGHGAEGRARYLILEWVDGPSLRRVIDDANRAGRRPFFAEAVTWIEQVSKGVAAVHAAGVIHRDLKPSNILIGPDGVARVADLGVARRVDAGHTSYTTTGAAPGTYAYMAPEQLSAPDTVDGRADLYALGLTFYELLTGVRPVGAWRPASEVNPTVPEAFDGVISRLLAPRPEQRFGDVYEVLAALSEFRPVPADVAGATPATGGTGLQGSARIDAAGRGAPVDPRERVEGLEKGLPGALRPQGDTLPQPGEPAAAAAVRIGLVPVPPASAMDETAWLQNEPAWVLTLGPETVTLADSKLSAVATLSRSDAEGAFELPSFLLNRKELTIRGGGQVY